MTRVAIRTADGIADIDARCDDVADVVADAVGVDSIRAARRTAGAPPRVTISPRAVARPS